MRLPALVLALTLTACAPTALTATDSPPHPPTHTRVTEVIDADTVRVAGLDPSIRIVGIDAPELGTCSGERAADWARKILAGRQVTVEPATAPHDDPYGRYLAHIRMGRGGRLYARIAVGQGYAEVETWPPNDGYEDVLTQAAAEAVDRGCG